MSGQCNPELCAREFEQIDERLKRIEDDTWRKDLQAKIEGLQVSVAKMEGRMAGYLAAAAVLAAVISALAQYVLKGQS